MTIQEYEEKLLQLIDDGIDTATDDELFAGGYLRGHISLAAAECESQNESQLSVMKEKVEQSITDAKSELSPSDWQLVLQYSDKLMA
ncbi:YfcL family protein [Photobacterium lucens]|uniref:YfcL family protein n=1 Tax=Photobacterium lucens TaxID=2562949 RepID=UPI00136A0721|nr:YfcL family protein [Photobacterium lucens]MBP2698830.1 YfcL family protein [Vibrio parahaemolyticus]MZG56839.1 YfcL family protein [Photobacterium lucens]MZG82474.1 YfcL family protein [Photobacterium lucens]